jgi:hypothetical protein
MARKSVKKPSESDFVRWLAEGYDKGYCSELYCENHDGVHRDDEAEWQEYWEQYGERDFCWAVVHVHYGVNG